MRARPSQLPIPSNQKCNWSSACACDDLPKATRQYGVVLPSEGVKIEMENYCLFGTLSIITDSWQITDTLHDVPIIAPRHVPLSPRVTKRLIQIMAGVYTVDMFVVHTHEYLFSEPQSNTSLDTQLLDVEQYI